MGFYEGLVVILGFGMVTGSITGWWLGPRQGPPRIARLMRILVLAPLLLFAATFLLSLPQLLIAAQVTLSLVIGFFFGAVTQTLAMGFAEKQVHSLPLPSLVLVIALWFVLLGMLLVFPTVF